MKFLPKFSLFKGALTVTLLSAFSVGKAELVITEIMQSNVSGIVDDLKNFPDSWIELYNDGESAVNLADYQIGLKKKVDKAFQLPDYEVKANEYVLIYCDKEEKGLHTSFRLESNKAGEIYLFKNGEQIQLLSHPAFPGPDIAYGLDPVSEEWGYELTATPGSANAGGICDPEYILGSPIFSVKGGVQSAPVSLVLELPDGAPEGAEIRYTLDGSLPTLESELFSTQSPIEISESTNVRAALFCEGWLQSYATTQSYLFPDHEITLPIFSITTDESYLYDSDFGLYKNLYEEWRRPANFEFFESGSSSAALNQHGEVKISGASSRQWESKSLAIYANKRFGEKRFDYEFFPEQRPGITDYKSLLLRNAGNDFYETYMRDAVIQNTVGNPMALDYQAGRPCVVFINGVYSGILNIRERSNEDNIATNYDGLEDIDMFENWMEIKEGDPDAMKEMWDFFQQKGHTLDEYKERIDVREVMDLHLANLYYNNTDFPGNNTIYWRPQEKGGKWRMILKDVDYGMGLKYGWGKGLPYDFEILNWLHQPDYASDANNWGNDAKEAAPFINMENFPELREEYIERALIYMGDFLNARATVPNIESWYRSIDSEWPYHVAYIRYPKTTSDTSLTENVEYMKDWILKRDTFFPLHFAEFYELGEMAYLEIAQPSADAGVKYEFNDFPLTTDQFTGYYPVGRNVKVYAEVDDPNARIIGWNVNFRRNKKAPGVYAEEDDSSQEFIDNTSDVLEFQCPQNVSYMFVQPVLDTSLIPADLVVTVVAGNDCPVEGIQINLDGPTDDDRYIAVTDADGKVSFEGIRKGTYGLSVTTDNFPLLYPCDSEIEIEDKSMDIQLSLEEKILNPSQLNYFVEDKEDNLIDIALDWTMADDEDWNESLGYMFNILINNILVGTTPLTRYTLTDVEPVDMTISVYALTPYGSQTESVSGTISMNHSSGVDEIYDSNPKGCIYYNLNGMRVSSGNLAPGLYILKSPGEEPRKVLIK